MRRPFKGSPSLTAGKDSAWTPDLSKAASANQAAAAACARPAAQCGMIINLGPHP
jgi:hypothetical protein